MNIFAVLGLLSAFGILYLGMSLSTPNVMLFVDEAAFFIVIGGTLVAASISFQINRIFVLFKIFFMRVLGGKRYDYAKIILEVMQVCEGYRRGASFKDLAHQTKDYFLKEALELADEGVLEKKELVNVVRDRADKMMQNYSEDAKKIKALGKYPPAFGLMGTSMGMVALLSSLGGEDAIKKMGPAMGIGLIATFYGVALANLFIAPVAENLADSAKEVYLKNQIIAEGIALLVDKTNPIIVAIKLNSFLSPKDRIDWKKVAKK